VSTPVRHSALFVWAEGTTEEQRTRVKDGVAYCYFASEVLSLDFGEDLGVEATRHGFSLQHEHRDRAAWDGYNENAAHARVGAFLKSISRPELAARVDWICDGTPSRRGAVRRLELHRWAEDAGERERADAKAAVASLRDRCPTVRALEIGDDLGWYPPNHDWIVEAQFDDVDGLKAFLDDAAQAEAAAAVAAVTSGEPARISYRMLFG
jgi:Stress responsive A/B Barrel Domain